MQKYLITGLGNMGEKYDNTRHNIGFDVVDAFAQKHNLKFEPSNFGLIAQFKFKGRPVTILKPDTYMNLSGKAIRFWLNKEKIKIENSLSITDDLNLSMGTIRMKGKGSDGGHNGLKSIQEELQTSKYPRFRFGIGDEFSKGKQIDFVLGKWDSKEQEILKNRIPDCVQAIETFIFNGLNKAMNEYNGS